MSETRRRNPNRLFAPLAGATAIAAGVFAVQSAFADKPADKPYDRAEALVHASTSVSEEIGDAESGWGHGAAERAIEKAVRKAVEASLDIMSPVRTADIDKLIKELPVFNQANEALDMAGYDEVVPDVGDQLELAVEVTVDSNMEDVSYEVTDAKIIDLPNNQE